MEPAHAWFFVCHGMTYWSADFQSDNVIEYPPPGSTAGILAVYALGGVGDERHGN